LATLPGVRGETGVKAVEAEAEAEEGNIRGGDEASAPKTRGNVIRNAIWAGTSGGT
jgi:hypothetical protein